MAGGDPAELGKGDDDMKFLHMIPDSSHLVSLAKNLEDIDSQDVHEIHVIPATSHKKSFLHEAREHWSSTQPFTGNLSFGPGDIVVMHSLFLPQSFEIAKQLIARRAPVVWCMWGGDLHMLAQANGGFAYINQFSCMVSFCGELALYPEITAPEIQGSCYKVDGTTGQTGRAKEKLIILGNSGDPSNDHAFLLELASKFTDHTLHIPFAYNVTPEYRAEVIRKASELDVMDRLILQEEMLPLEDYNSIIARAELFLAAHNRQQALGSLASAYLNDCRVFMRRVITTKSGKTMANPGYLQMLNFGYVDVEDIRSLQNEDFRRSVEMNPRVQNEVADVHTQSTENRASVFQKIKHICLS